ncbi:hypothetical protein ACIP9H_16490 [Streptomyces sp. NPDC088732]|uniref:hypothetical protein n=1 Tax=Streptomyces sp. NPDC088732 TaxID=3365879 RepID=UPI00380773EB
MAGGAACGREIEPRAGYIDSQPIRTACTVPAVTKGYSASNTFEGRKRFGVTETPGRSWPPTS